MLILMPHFLAFGRHGRFRMNDYIVRMYSKIASNISSGGYGFNVNAAVFEISVHIFTHNLHLNAPFAS